MLAPITTIKYLQAGPFSAAIVATRELHEAFCRREASYLFSEGASHRNPVQRASSLLSRLMVRHTPTVAYNKDMLLYRNIRA